MLRLLQKSSGRNGHNGHCLGHDTSEEAEIHTQRTRRRIAQRHSRAVLETRPQGLLIETDAGPLRTLPEAYVAEHVEHDYCLTGRGMQGGTVEHATVVAATRALTRWSYTTLSRARAMTRLHIDGQDVPAGSRPSAPSSRLTTPGCARSAATWSPGPLSA
jgi:ATP-dependent exoDNAse (exonuclease V) alpha subunit